MATFVFSSLLCNLNSGKKSRVHSCPSSSYSHQLISAQGLVESDQAKDVSSLMQESSLSSSLELVLSTQACVLAQTQNLKHTLSLSSDEKRLIEQYMDNSLRLLDDCVLVRDALEHHSRSVKKVRHALNILESRRTSAIYMQRARRALSSVMQDKDETGKISCSKLATRGSMLREMGNKLRMIGQDCSSEENGSLEAVVYRGQVALLSFFKLVLSDVLLSESKNGTCRFMWEVARVSLLRRSRKVIKQRPLAELAVLMHRSVRELNENLGADKENFGLILDSTRRDVCELEGRLTCLHSHMHHVYKVLVDTRMVMLNSLSKATPF